jgi:hypothetical protein
MDKVEVEKKAIAYLNNNKKVFFEKYTQNIKQSNNKLAIFTAGMSGVGKTEFAIYLKENSNELLHIDTDEIRKFFQPVGYNGQNANLFQKPSSRGFSELFNYALKNNYSLILDSNLSSINQATQNIERLLKRDYVVVINYFYNSPKKCFEYAIRREVVTHRKVPKEIFIKSNINSFTTVIKLKSIFKENIVLNFFDKRDDKFYKNIDSDFLQKEIGNEFNF